MGVASRTEFHREDDDIVASLEEPGDGHQRQVYIKRLTPEAMEDAIEFVAREYKHREPLLRFLQSHQEFKELDLKRLLTAKFHEYASTSYIAREVVQSPCLCDIKDCMHCPIVGVVLGHMHQLTDTAPALSFKANDFHLQYYLNACSSQIPIADAVNLARSITKHRQGLKLHTNQASDIQRIFSVDAIAVDRTLCTKMLATGLVSKCMDRARSLSCHAIMCDSTSKFLAKALQSHGFIEVVSIAFPAFSGASKKIDVEPAYPHECLRVLVFDLTHHL